MAAKQCITPRVPDCHPDRKHNARGMCNTCYARWLKQKNPDYRSRQREQSAHIRRERGAVYKANQRPRLLALYRQPEFKHGQRWRKIKFRYGISMDAFIDLLAAQRNACPICLRELGTSGRNVHVDHDHATGKVRGILCASCNSMLGKIERDRGRMKRMAAYLGMVVPGLNWKGTNA